MDKIKAIETTWNGYKFRSRLEARWAVFLEEIGLHFDYEKDGFNLPSGPYLPDFWIQEWDTWLEIKGVEPTDEEFKKCEELHYLTHNPVLLFSGLPDRQGILICQDTTDSSGGLFRGNCGFFKQYNIPILAVQERSDRIFYDLDYKHLWWVINVAPFMNTKSPIEAIKRSRSARFEHGEKP
jgi:hypothetical protein